MAKLNLRSALRGWERGINLAGALAGLLLFIGAVGAYIFRNHVLALLLVSFALGLLVRQAASSAYRSKDPAPLPLRVQKGYEYRRVHCVYAVDARNHLHHIVETSAIIEANRGNVLYYQSHYAWSGGDRTEARVISQGHYKMGPERGYGRDKHFVVFLGSPLVPGVPVTATTVIDCYATDLESVTPFIERKIQQPHDLLILTVNLPDDAPELTAWGCKSNDSGQPVALELTQSPSKRQATLHVDKPEVGSTYTLAWHWPQQWLEETYLHLPTSASERKVEQ